MPSEVFLEDSASFLRIMFVICVPVNGKLETTQALDFVAAAESDIAEEDTVLGGENASRLGNMVGEEQLMFKSCE